MDTKKPRHKLSNVDLERRTATCAVCGETTIYAGYDDRWDKHTFGCVNRVKSNAGAYRQRIKKQKREDPNWKPRHTVTDVDVETMTGVCSVCGVIKVYLRTSGGKKYYLCVKKRKTEWQASHRKRYAPHPQSEPSVMTSLPESQLELFDRYKGELGCQKCGYDANPNQLELHFHDVDEKEFTIAKLLQFTRKRLLHALKTSEVYCVNCHSLIHGETVSA